MGELHSALLDEEDVIVFGPLHSGKYEITFGTKGEGDVYVVQNDGCPVAIAGSHDAALALIRDHADVQSAVVLF
ncbi:hypothetical protein Q2100_17955 [Mycolicibacterium sp. KC 300]|uniref:Uncharacterized protein n=2 Tax=Mycolicibacterium arseniciresistens TaxID=3062257 RepID=A0ABT8ULD6_9MYCO|nr:hypothetical protein [Mycolicibacterium arseniciresistens]